MNVLLFAGSLRRASSNKKLILATESILRSTYSNLQIEVLDLKNYPMPPYDGDIQENEGIPSSTVSLVEKIAQAQAVVVSVPEYNGSISGTFKNVLDWTSRVPKVPWKNKPVLLIGASPGALGATRALWHTRVPFDVMGAFLYPDMFGLSAAHEAFLNDGSLKDVKQIERLKGLLQNFVEFSKKFEPL